MDLTIARKKVDIPARCPYDLTSLKGNIVREYYICIRGHLLRSVTTRCNLNVSIASLRCGISVIPGTIFMLDAAGNHMEPNNARIGRSLIFMVQDFKTQVVVDIILVILELITNSVTMLKAWCLASFPCLSRYHNWEII